MPKVWAWLNLPGRGIEFANPTSTLTSIPPLNDTRNCPLSCSVVASPHVVVSGSPSMGSQNVSKHPPLCKPLTRLDALAPLPPPPPLSENPKTPTANPNPDPDLLPASPSHSASSTSPLRDPADESRINADVLSREEVLRRRSRRLKRLERCYMEQYWALVEELREKHREYYWNHGVSPVVEEGAEPVAPRSKCAFAGCKTNAMPLTRFCHAHILSDRDQTLYKPCSYALKSGHSGPITCGKPVLRAAVPSLCPVHFQKAQKHISYALKKAGLTPSCSTRPAPKFHVLIAEYVNQIQAKRREAVTAEADRATG